MSSWRNALNGHMRGYRRAKQTRVKRYHINCANAVKRSRSKLTRYTKRIIWRQTRA